MSAPHPAGAAPDAAADAPPGRVAQAHFPADPDLGPAFELRRPARRTTPLVHASSHSGRLYPAQMMRLCALDRQAVRSSEDAYVDLLVERAPEHGGPLLLARHARAYVDLNRAAYELDPSMFDSPAPRAFTRTPRAAAGLGSVARIVAEGSEIYRAPLAFAEAEARLAEVHAPWHAQLDGLMAESVAGFGCAVLLDWHSMPAAAVATGRGAPPEVVLGDRHGSAASRAVVERVAAAFEREGWRTTRNRPYAGGHVIERQGRPAERRHAVQVELRRDLYLDEATLALGSGFDAVRATLDRVVTALSGADWTALA